MEMDLYLESRKIMELGRKNAENYLLLKKSNEYELFTGLLNKVAFDKKLEKVFFESISERKRLNDTSKKAFLLDLIDLNGLKKVNDSDGHAAGDELIQETAKSIKERGRRWTTSWGGRLGGDEFGIIQLIDTDPDSIPEILKEAAEKTDQFLKDAKNKRISFGLGRVILIPKMEEMYTMTFHLGKDIEGSLKILSDENSPKIFKGSSTDLKSIADKALYVSKNILKK